MYEWTRTFHPNTDAENGVCTEAHRLWAIADGAVETDRWNGKPRQATVWRFKGIIEEIGTTLGLALTIEGPDSAHPLSDCLHPGRCASVQLNGQTVGVFGEVHPRITKAFKLKRVRPIYMELDRDALLKAAVQTRYVERSVHQPILRSLAFSLPTKITAGRVVDVLRTDGPEWLDAVDIVDLFEHDSDGQPMRAVTFALRFSNDAGDRSADAVNQACEMLIEAVDSALGSLGVRLRA